MAGERIASSGRARFLAAAMMLAVVGLAFIGRSVLSADDGAEMMSDTLGFLVQGRFESATLPPTSPDPFLPPAPPFRSRYGLFASLLPLPFLGVAWPFQQYLGAAGVDAAASLTWAAGALLAALAFLRLARTLQPGASPLWAPAFLGGTYLWTYVADSYVEPWAAAGLAFSAALLLEEPCRDAARGALAASLAATLSFWLRPVAWILAPVLVLAALLRWRDREDGARRALWLLAGLGAGLAAVMALNRALHGSPFDFGHGFSGEMPFVHGPLEALARTYLLPGRGVVFYAPVVLAALFAARRLPIPARVLCLVAPLVLVAVSARWFVWHGGSCWGPRFLIPVLPLLVAPAVLAPKRLAAALLAVGAVVNLPGVLVAAGAWQAYAERLTAPPAAGWPRLGGDRVSEITALSPLYGHAWLLGELAAPGRLPAPWLQKGVRETTPRPKAAEMVSPWIVRRALGLSPVPPFLPRLLLRSALAYYQRGRPAEAVLFASAAFELDPQNADAVRLLKAAREARARR
jgi:hypothetical protein